MNRRYKILLTLLMVALLVTGSLELPMGRVCAQGEDTQQPASSTERVPLPVPPPEMDHYELKFSRELTADEQRVWDKLWDELGKNPDLFANNPAEIFYTERAHAKLTSALDWLDDEHRYRIGDGSPGTILLDFGTVTVSDTVDGSLWYDMSSGIFHLPMQYVMTDEELLQYIDMTTTVERRTALGALPTSSANSRPSSLPASGHRGYMEGMWARSPRLRFSPQSANETVAVVNPGGIFGSRPKITC